MAIASCVLLFISSPLQVPLSKHSPFQKLLCFQRRQRLPSQCADLSLFDSPNSHLTFWRIFRVLAILVHCVSQCPIAKFPNPKSHFSGYDSSDDEEDGFRKHEQKRAERERAAYVSFRLLFLFLCFLSCFLSFLFCLLLLPHRIGSSMDFVLGVVAHA